MTAEPRTEGKAMAARARETEFDQLKDLLQRDQRAELAELREMVAMVEARALQASELDAGVRQTMQQSLAEVIHQLPDDRRDRLNNELSALLNESMDSRIKAAEPALMDRMNQGAGSLVRKGIGQAMAELVETIQQQINQQLSFTERAKAQMSAMGGGQAGGAEGVLQRALQGRATSALLIHRTTGLLITSVDTDGQASTGDEDTLKGSLITAIIAFADEAMGTEGVSLDTLKFGERTLVLSAQPQTVLALDYDGVPPVGASSWLDAQLSDLSRTYGRVFEGFSGALDAQDAQALRSELLEILAAEPDDMGSQIQEIAKATRTHVGQELMAALPMIGMFLAILGGGFFGFKGWQAGRLESAAEALAQDLAAERIYDLQLKYAHDASQFTVLSGVVVGRETRVRLAAGMQAAYPYANIDLSGLKVFQGDGAFQ